MSSLRHTFWEKAVLLFSLGLSLLLRLFNLQEMPTKRLFDEGVHLGLMQQIAETDAVLYRDLLFIHPPGVIWAGAGLWTLGISELFTLRLCAILFNSLLFVPVSLLACRLYGKRTAALSLVLLAVTPAFSGWMGRAVMLEPPLNVLLYSAMALSLTASSPQRGLLAGSVLGLGVLIKETALIMGVVWGAVFWGSQWRLREHSKCAAFVVGFVCVSGILVAALSCIPNFWRDTVVLNGRDPYTMMGRIEELQNGIFQMPLALVLGIGAAFIALRQSSSQDERLCARWVLICALLMLLLAKRFYWRHLLCVLPLCTIFAAQALMCFYQRIRQGNSLPKRTRWIFGSLIGVLVCIQLITLIAPFFSERADALHERKAFAILEHQPNPVFSFAPLWVVTAKKQFPAGEFALDSIYARQFGIISETQMLAMLRQCPTVFLNRDSISYMTPAMWKVLQTEYRSLYRTGMQREKGYIEIWTQTASSKTPAVSQDARNSGGFIHAAR